VERFKAAMKQAGLKLTPQRMEVFREIAGREDHPDAVGVFTSIRERMPSVSLDTVYRTLWMLKDLGLISVIGSNRESARFDGNLGKHHHFVCVRCGLVRDFEKEELNALPIENDVRKYGSVLETQIEVHGICNACRNTHGDSITSE
jgi:Fur family peroxide stress response transcriptional regulator